MGVAVFEFIFGMNAEGLFTVGKTFKGEKIAIAGLFRTRCGIQRGAELMRMKMLRDKAVILPICLSRKLNAPINLTQLNFNLFEPEDMEYLQPTDLIIHLNPPFFSSILPLFGEKALKNCCVVGYWNWEIDKVSDDWRVAARSCDEIWVPSQFLAGVMRKELDGFGGAIRVRPHPVDVDPMPKFTEEERAAYRQSLDISASDFVVGLSFSFNSNFTRKNPLGAIGGFQGAFGSENQDVRLLIRCNDAGPHQELMEILIEEARKDQRIWIFDEKNKISIVNFYKIIDVYLSLHRSEGYGLNLAEAAQTGMPVLATAWGLAEDIAARDEVITIGYQTTSILDPQHFYSSYPAAVWAEPDIEQAAQYLRKIHSYFISNRSTRGYLESY